MGTAQRVSMTDVARRAGVSQKTVSRVVNGEPHVTEAVRAKVRAVIDELGYRPNAAARALVTRRNQRVGMVAMGTSLYGPASILEGVDDALRRSGYYLSVARTRRNQVADLQSAVDELVAQDIAGLVLAEPIERGRAQPANTQHPNTQPANTQHANTQQSLTDHVHTDLRIPSGLPVLSFGSPTSPDTTTARPGQLVLGADEAGGARAATEHLLALGHRTVHHVAGAKGWSATARRISGWRDALADIGVAAPPVVHGDWTPRSGYEATTELLRRGGVTAIFAANDHMAIGAVRAVQDAGLRVPGGVSVVGFDDAPEAAFLSIALTTVRQDFAEVTRLAVDHLVRTIEGRPPSERHRLVPAHLVVRESTAPPPA